MPNLEEQRAAAEEKARRRTTRAPDDRCGTVTGYFAHRRKKVPERACKACRMAWAAHVREYRKRKKEQQ